MATTITVQKLRAACWDPRRKGIILAVDDVPTLTANPVLMAFSSILLADFSFSGTHELFCRIVSGKAGTIGVVLLKGDFFLPVKLKNTGNM